jgi:hypothetical protein
MGAADANLIYGILLTGEYDEFEHPKSWGDDEWDDVYADRLGRLEDEYSFQTIKRLNKQNVEIVSIAGSYDFGTKAVSFAPLEGSATDYGVKEVKLPNLMIHEWEAINAEIKEFCALMDLPYSDPKWYLGAFYG